MSANQSTSVGCDRGNSVPPPSRRRLLLPLILLLAVAVSALWWAPPLFGRYHAMVWRQQCMNYLPPADQVVYEEEASAVAALQDQPGYELTEGSRLRWIPNCWRNEMPPCAQMQGNVFLHERISRAGHVRLVAIDLNVQPGSLLTSTGDIEDISFSGTVIKPGSGFSPDQPLCQGQTIMWICPADPKPMRFYSGKPDASAPSRFSFDYERAGMRGTIDGRLNDDDTLTLVPRRGTVSRARLPLLWEPDEDAVTAAATQPGQ
jgi:hypothetical protein